MLILGDFEVPGLGVLGYGISALLYLAFCGALADDVALPEGLRAEIRRMRGGSSAGSPIDDITKGWPEKRLPRKEQLTAHRICELFKSAVKK